MDKKPQSRSTRYRHRKAQEAAQHTSGGLPMPYVRDTMPTVEERAEYRARQERHHALDPDYERTWERPTPEKAQAVYDRVRIHVPDLSTIHPDPVTAMQLLTVTLDAAVVSARYGRRVDDRQGLSDQELLRRIKRAVTRNVVTDAIMRRWSDHARLARKEGRAYAVRQMAVSTAKNAWRDLLVQDIHVPVLWETLIKHSEGRDHPLFHVRGAKQTGEGYDIILHRGPVLRAFEKLVQRDAAYKHSRVSHALRLWIVGDDPPPVDHSDPICAEREYNKVTIGPRTQAILDLQASVQLLFDAPRFVADYKRVRAARKHLRAIAVYTARGLPWKSIVKAPWKLLDNATRLLRERELKMKLFLLEFRSIFDQVRRERAPLKVQSEFYKIVNRRYQNAHFFPMQTSAKNDPRRPEEFEVGSMWGDGNEGEGDPGSEFWEIVSTARTRWFSVPSPSGPQPLVSMDVSASQTQIQAILFSNEEMEADAFGPQPHKAKLAERAWNMRKGGTVRTDTLQLEAILKKIQSQFRAALSVAHPDKGGTDAARRAPIEKRERDRAAAIKNSDKQVNTAFLPDLIVESPENPDGYHSQDDPRLAERMKNLWMLRGYGPLIPEIMRDQAKKPDLYGPGWRLRKRPLTKKEAFDALADSLEGGPPAPDYKMVLDERGVILLLATVPGWIEREQFLTSCKNAACDLIEADPYAGATLLDPFDGSTFTWNRPLMAADRLSLHKWEITLLKPGSYRRSDRIGRYLDEECPRNCGGRGKLRGSHWRCRNWKCGHVWQGTFHPAAARADGALQVDDDKLRKMLAPCIIHVLDSLFSSLVMEALVADGVTTVLAIHDCWYAPQTVHHTDGREPESGYVVLERAIKAAGEPWLLALKTVYEWMIDNHVGAVKMPDGSWHSDHQIEDAYAKWEARVARGDWPHFFAVPGKQDPPALTSPSTTACDCDTSP